MKTIVRLLVAATLFASSATAQQQTAVNAKEFEAALAANPQGADADRLVERIREAFGGREALMAGPQPRITETTVLWAVELEAPVQGQGPRVVRPMGGLSYPMRRVGTSNVYALARTFSSGEAFAWNYSAGPITRAGTLEVYNIHPDARVQAGVPKGEVRQMPAWTSQIFAGTTRDWWVYVPAQYRPESPAAVMIFQDGAGARNYVVPVLDNLIAKGDIPVMVAIFLEPGGINNPRSNRSVEYDRLNDLYARFLLEEILPEVQKTVNLRQDAAGRGIAGQSSGAIAAFTAAWQRPDAFHKVLSGIGSYTNIQGGESGIAGGHNYQAMLRRTPRKNIRVFLQDGENDLDNEFGSWWLANQTLARSLAWAGYDYQFVTGKGYHSNGHMIAILPDALRWLWRDDPAVLSR